MKKKPEVLAEERLHEKRKMNCGLTAEIIKYNNYSDITVQFETGAIREHITYQQFCSGSVLGVPKIEPPSKKNRLQEVRTMNCGQTATIIGYRNALDLDIQFEDGNIRRHVTYQKFKNGTILPKSTREENDRSETLGDRIRIVRMQLGLTCEEFGKRIGTSKSNISSIERNVRGTSRQLILSICNEYNVHEEWLRNGTGEIFRSQNEQISHFISSLTQNPESFQSKLIYVMATLSSEEWELVESIVKRLSGENLDTISLIDTVNNTNKADEEIQ